MNHPTDAQHQAAALREGAGFFRLPPRSLIEISGADRATFLHNLCTQDMRHCPVGGGRELFVTSVQGKTLGHGFALVLDDCIWLVTPSACSSALLSHLNRYIIREDVALRDLSDQYVEFLLCGSQWESLTPALLSIREMWSHLSTESPKPCVWLVRTAWSIKPNYMLVTLAVDESHVVSRLEQAGGVRCDDAWFDRLRIEAGFPEYGRDITERNLPQEIDRNQQAISFTKGCYLGQETVARLDALGHVNWRVRGVRAPLDTPLTAGLEIESAGAVIARVTSTAVSPHNNQQIGLALIRTAHAARGTTLNWLGHSLTVADLPLCDD